MAKLLRLLKNKMSPKAQKTAAKLTAKLLKRRSTY